MGHPKSPLGYPPEYFKLLQKAQLESVAIPFPDDKAARLFQMRFGAFRRSLINNSELHPNDAILAYNIETRRRGNVLVVQSIRCEPEVSQALGEI